MGEVGNVGDREVGKKLTPHVLFISASPRGHLAPSFYWALEVARQGILVTIVSFQNEIAQMCSEHESEIRGLTTLRFLTLPRPEGVPVVQRDLVLGTLLQISFKDLNIREQLAADNQPPTCVVASMFVSWANQVALDLQIPRYTLICGGAAIARFIQASKDAFFRDGVRISNEDLLRESAEGGIDTGAGVPKMKFHELPSLVHIPPILLKLSREMIGDAHGIVLNSFHDLEPEAIDALRKFRSTTNQKFYAVGPLRPELSRQAVVGESKNSEDDCLRWLDSQPKSSVVYVCFGKFFGATPQQVKDVADGLESSKHRFIWALPDPSGSPGDSKPDVDLLPIGFEERVADFGYVIKGWAPQLRVLSHPSTGGFLTNCGWNSVLEAITTEVPMIALPGTADQHVHCRHLVDKLMVAAEIRRGTDNVPESNAVETAIRQVMEGEEGKAIKARLQELRAAAAAALDSDGSSIRDRHQFFEDVRIL